MKIYGLIVDAGDGSGYIQFFKNWETAEKVMEEDPEAYYANEGEPSVTLNLPDDLDLKEAGISLYEVEDND